MRKTVTATALACALSLSTVTSSLAEGPEANMSRDQVKSAMLVSTQGSFGVSGPSSGPASSVQGSLSPVVIVLGLLVVLTIAATRGGGHWYYSS